MTNSDDVDLTPITRTKEIVWRVDADELYALLGELHDLIMREGLREVSDGVSINPIRLYHLVELPNTHKTRRTLLKLCKYFGIPSERFATRYEFWG